MPPKRKASSLSTNDEPPKTRRTLRSNGPTPAVPEPTPKPRATRSTKRGPTKASSKIDAAKETEPPVPSSPPRTRRKTRCNPSPSPGPEGASTSRIQPPDPITTSRRGNHAQIDDNDPDELLLPSPKKHHRPPVTPVPTTTPKVGTPRTFMQCVEIVSTPKHVLTGTPSGSKPRLFGDAPTTPGRAATPSPLKQVLKKSASPSKTRQPGDLPLSSSPRKSPPGLALGRSPPPSPRRSCLAAPVPSLPPKRKIAGSAETTLTRLPRILPEHLHPALRDQQRAIFKSLRSPPQLDTKDLDTDDEDNEPSTNDIAYEQLCNLLKGTVVRGEGNSCLLIGPRGSGKTRLVERALASLPERPMIIRLSGFTQQNDRLAVREIARQLAQQTGNSFLLNDDEEKHEEDGFNDPENPLRDTAEVSDAQVSIALPAPAQLLALISIIPTLPRATVVIIDAFDQFASHARQSLLYCLLDTVQSCRAAKGNKGLAVIGVTTRVDTINLLEKRVKSRFSGRMLRTACPGRFQYWVNLSRAMLTAPIDAAEYGEWNSLWASSVESFLCQDAVVEALKETFALTRDVYTLTRILTQVVLGLSPTSPQLSSATLGVSVTAQRYPPRFPFLSTLPYPAICLLIAAMHAQTSGHDVFTFEMLHEAFRDQVRTSQSAPVQVGGGSIGMVRCSREVLVGAFEQLRSLKAFVEAAAASSSITREFVLHRCVVDRADVKKAVDTMGQTNLKKWLNRMQ